MSEGNFQVHIDLDIKDGEMLVGEFILPGDSSESVALLADYCHPGQANDSWSGVLAMIDVVKRLSDTKRHYTYRFLLFPETIGSCILLEDKPEYIQNTKLAIFSEFVGWGDNWTVLKSPNNGIVDRLLENVKSETNFQIFDLYTGNGYGNDEMIYDFAGVPSMSVQLNHCEEYHSSNDKPSMLDQTNLDIASNLILEICSTFEKDLYLQLVYKVPFYMTRFDLYEDAVLSPNLLRAARQIIFGIRDGFSLLQIAKKNDLQLDDVYTYAMKLVDAGVANVKTSIDF